MKDITLGEIFEIVETITNPHFRLGDLIPKRKPIPLQVGDVIDGDIVYKVDDEYIYLVAPAIKRFVANWYEAGGKCKAEEYEPPSIEELEEIYNHRNEIDAADNSDGELTLASFVSCDGYVWSSTEYNGSSAWSLNFGNGSLANYTKTYYDFVVPVRKIKLEDLK